MLVQYRVTTRFNKNESYSLHGIMNLVGRRSFDGTCVHVRRRRGAHDELPALQLQVAQLALGVLDPLLKLDQGLVARRELRLQATRYSAKIRQPVLALTHLVLASASVGDPAVGEGSALLRETVRRSGGEFYGAVHLLRRRVVQHRVILKHDERERINKEIIRFFINDQPDAGIKSAISN